MDNICPGHGYEATFEEVKNQKSIFLSTRFSSLVSVMHPCHENQLLCSRVKVQYQNRRSKSTAPTRMYGAHVTLLKLQDKCRLLMLEVVERRAHRYNIPEESLQYYKTAN